MKTDLTDFIFEKLGLVKNEEFRIKNNMYAFRINENLVLEYYNGTEEMWEESFGVRLSDAINGTIEIIKTIKLTEIDKKAKDYFVGIGCHLVARDCDGDMFAYERKPVKEEGFWYSACEQLEVSNKCFKFILWNDEEPTDLRTL